MTFKSVPDPSGARNASMDGSGLRQRLRYALAGLAEPGPAPQSAATARLLVRQLGGLPAVAEVLSALDRACSSKRCCQQLLQLAEQAVSECTAQQLAQCVAAVNKQV